VGDFPHLSISFQGYNQRNYSFRFPIDGAHLKCIKERVEHCVIYSAAALSRHGNYECWTRLCEHFAKALNATKLFNEVASAIVVSKEEVDICMISKHYPSGAALVSAVYQSLGVHFFTPTCAQTSVINMRLGPTRLFSSVSLLRSEPISIARATIINLHRKGKGTARKVSLIRQRSSTTCALDSAVWIATRRRMRRLGGCNW
jgi:hypothetical protein